MGKIRARWVRSKSDKQADYGIGEDVYCFVNHKVGTVKRIIPFGNRMKYVVRFADGNEECFTRDELDYGNRRETVAA